MNRSEEKLQESLNEQEGDDLLLTQSQKDSSMTSARSDTKFVLSCWWSRGPSGQVQEWESRPTTDENTSRTHQEHRSSTAHWRKSSRHLKRTKI